MSDKPEAQARIAIDKALEEAGWRVQDWKHAHLEAAPGVALRELPVKKGGRAGFADYVLFVDGKACGVVEAKAVGTTLSGVTGQSMRYSQGLPDDMETHLRPLPFLYQTTGAETSFYNDLDPEPRSRLVFSFHRPETLRAWLAAEALWLPAQPGSPDPAPPRPSTLRGRLQRLPILDERGLWGVQPKAVRGLEASLGRGDPRALIQMATGSGKTFTAVTAAYRMLRHGKAHRLLFLVDRQNLGRQALTEFRKYTSPEDGGRFVEDFNVQLLTSNKIDPVAKVVITTIQRLYSILQGEEFDPALEERSLFDEPPLLRAPVSVSYDKDHPPELFDVIFIDECHRSIYGLWRQVLTYFDAFLIGLTATPLKQTFGFFDQNVVTEYPHEQAVADGVNVACSGYKLYTKITRQGSTIEAGPHEGVIKRDRRTRKERWEQLDEDIVYPPSALDREVVSMGQIRTILTGFRDRLFTEIFPGRTDVPKTLIFAKDDSHAEDIVKIAREVFGKGDAFAQKITYLSTGDKPEDLIKAFRTGYNPRIAVTVDMIATGTDIKPLEIVLFLRLVKSRGFFEQMKGRGVRVVEQTDYRQVTVDPEAAAKDRYVLVDCVGVLEAELKESPPLERNPTVTFGALLDATGVKRLNEDHLASLAGRLARLARRVGPEQRAQIAALSGGKSLNDLAAELQRGTDVDEQLAEARRLAGLGEGAALSAAQQAAGQAAVMKGAVASLRQNPPLRDYLKGLQGFIEQVLDERSVDAVVEAGFVDEAPGLVRSFEAFLAEHRDEIEALQVLYGSASKGRLRLREVKALAKALKAPPRSWTPDDVWAAYERLGRVRSARGPLVLADLVRLVRLALGQRAELAPFKQEAEERFAGWLLQQENQGQRFTAEQRKWLEQIRDHIIGSLEIESGDLDELPFNRSGGSMKAHQLFGGRLEEIMKELNEVLAA